MTRAMDEVIRRMPVDLEHAALALGSTKFEVAMQVVTRQMLPGIITGILLAFGRGIGDAASVLFTAGYTDRIPTSLMNPTASLPLAVFFQLGSPYAEVRERGYAAALILTIIVLIVSLGSRLLAARLNKYTVSNGAKNGCTYSSKKSQCLLRQTTSLDKCQYRNSQKPNYQQSWDPPAAARPLY
jgi:phosphate transport system permease protein